nr:M3 family metallopeptidase [Candidatus Sigynarchaeota archaeon]
MVTANDLPSTKERKYIPPSITGSSWRPINKALKGFQQEPLDTPSAILSFIERYTELYDIVETQTMIRGAHYLANTNVRNALKVAGYALRVTLPAFLARQRLFKQLNANEHFHALPPEHDHMKRIIAKEIAYKSHLVSKAIEYLKVLSYSRKMSSLRVDHGGQALSLKKASVFLQNTDRTVRQAVWEKISAVVLKQSGNLNKIFDSVRGMREARAKSAGFDTCRDYYHVTKGRFDYTPDDCFKFHESVEKEVVPFIKQLNEVKRAALGVDVLKPWDKKVEIGEIEKPYATPGELVDKMVAAFSKVRPEYGKTLGMMRDAGFIDHENRRGKVPGAMSIPLVDHECGYIIANTVGVEDDVRTLAHEGGHSVHWAAAAGVP